MIDRRLIINFEWLLLVMVLLICGIGLANLYSTGHTLNFPRGSAPCVKQFYWILLGLFCMTVATAIDYRYVVQYAYIIFGFSVILLIGVSLYGKIAQGSQRWLIIGGLSIQPSEMIKLTVVLFLARYASDVFPEGGFTTKSLVVPACILSLPVIMIGLQPDLGTALFIFILSVSIILFVGIRWKTIIALLLICLMIMPLFWFLLRDYQRSRILTFLDPERDPLGTGYHIIQSMIAVGSGGFMGKGLFKGTQTQLKFLPEQHTDFVFSVFAEEWGFVGVMLLIGCYLTIILWGLNIARHARDLPGMFIAYGITAYIFLGVTINIGMVIGIFPVVGIPLPFLSYGGSAMIVLMTGIGLLLNVSMRRFILSR
ncbi:MAG: rod shape-determining protein RodA [Deltaproteobacteria bacterium]|nr:rod shape-determining protein RodA [Deltaproteobacteria bacterium]